MDANNAKTQDKDTPPGFFAIALSTLAAAVGVQSGRNQARDFSQGKVGHYIAAGIIFTVAFVVGLVLVVQKVLETSGL
ncbi:DUF2970 domain-containing protein [Simiduia agarivorans]|uniref:DUF2970 domain-containing protein n=1 Tax=Simiduia agarivorans (strain DSM 21679 / JCM 13881 / BCRC 17597 / SA1) TaxID=1117647 RepID=K4KF37_SIMAS|nr:DUF2970 domain-containing protein [Simiduia agarivorans]AFU97649.1 hypothetical protein M5M_02150 [Simiduia agarivorans SA1 = DSM 21679]